MATNPALMARTALVAEACSALKMADISVYSLCGCLNDLRLACCFSIRLLRSLSMLPDMILVLSVRRYCIKDDNCFVSGRKIDRIA
jgi:hypothetical protein